MRKNNKKIAQTAILAALAIIFGYVEGLFPLPVPIYGVKVGISNSVILSAIYMLNGGVAFGIMFIKTISSALLFQGFSAFLYSFSGGILSVLFMYILKKLKVKNDIFVPLIGMIFGGIIASITSFITYALDMNQTVNAYFQGSFSTVIKGRYELLYICIPMIVLAFIYANKFTIAKMGQDFSKNLGLNYQGVVNLGLIVVSCISGLTLVMVGNIPFLGLVVPNIIVLLKGDNLKNILVDTCLFGATFILLCDIISRSIIRPYEVSIGLTVGVIGSAIFLYLVLRRQDGK